LTDGKESSISLPIENENIKEIKDNGIVDESQEPNIEIEIGDSDDLDDYLVENAEGGLSETKNSDTKGNFRSSLKSKLLQLKAFGRLSKKFSGNSKVISAILVISTLTIFTFFAYKLYKSTKKHETVIWQSLYPESYNEKLTSEIQDSVSIMV